MHDCTITTKHSALALAAALAARAEQVSRRDLSHRDRALAPHRTGSTSPPPRLPVPDASA